MTTSQLSFFFIKKKRKEKENDNKNLDSRRRVGFLYAATRLYLNLSKPNVGDSYLLYIYISQTTCSSWMRLDYNYWIQRLPVQNNISCFYGVVSFQGFASYSNPSALTMSGNSDCKVYVGKFHLNFVNFVLLGLVRKL